MVAYTLFIMLVAELFIELFRQAHIDTMVIAGCKLAEVVTHIERIEVGQLFA
jgi:hypothetical protein